MKINQPSQGTDRHLLKPSQMQTSAQSIKYTKWREKNLPRSPKVKTKYQIKSQLPTSKVEILNLKNLWKSQRAIFREKEKKWCALTPIWRHASVRRDPSIARIFQEIKNLQRKLIAPKSLWRISEVARFRHPRFFEFYLFILIKVNKRYIFLYFKIERWVMIYSWKPTALSSKSQTMLSMSSTMLSQGKIKNLKRLRTSSKYLKFRRAKIQWSQWNIQKLLKKRSKQKWRSSKKSRGKRRRTLKKFLKWRKKISKFIPASTSLTKRRWSTKKLRNSPRTWRTRTKRKSTKDSKKWKTLKTNQKNNWISFII